MDIQEGSMSESATPRSNTGVQLLLSHTKSDQGVVDPLMLPSCIGISMIPATKLLLVMFSESAR